MECGGLALCPKELPKDRLMWRSRPYQPRIVARWLWHVLLSETTREPLQLQHLFHAHKTLLVCEEVANRHTPRACQTWHSVIHCVDCPAMAINDIGFLLRPGTMFLQLFQGCIKCLRRPSSLARVGNHGLLVPLDLCKEALKLSAQQIGDTSSL